MGNFICRTVFIVSVIFLFACNNQKEQNEIPSETYEQYLRKGREIAGEAQATLLSVVSDALQRGDAEYAVEFCNVQASPIVDSLGRQHDVIIGRVSEKNRNPDNNLKNSAEKQLWKDMAKAIKEGNAHDTLLMTDNELVFYRPIKTLMPACLECHGVPEEDILPSTLKKIQTLYPKDKATGYDLNEFRGLWKIRFTNPELPQSHQKEL